jgi:hypothetical protein
LDINHEEYRYYFDSFVAAQKTLPLKPFQHAFVRQLPSMYPSFISAATAADIPAAVRYKQQVKQASAAERNGNGAQYNRGQQQAQADCCIIL